MPSRINLDLDTLRTLVVAHDRGGLAQAASYLGRTPSALSLQVKRLQEDLGVALFRKRGRGLVLTEAGGIALAHARRILALNDELLETMQGANLAGQIRIGCSQDFASILPSVLSHFATLYPRMKVELHIEGNSALVDAVNNARLDLAIVIGSEPHVNASTVGQVDVVWIASSNFRAPQDAALPIAVMGAQCPFRRSAVTQLERAGIPHLVVAHSPSLNGLWAALLSGLAVTARTALNLPDGLVAAESLLRLPPLGSLRVALHRGVQSKGIAVDRMASLLIDALDLILQAKPKSARASDRVETRPHRRSMKGKSTSPVA